MKKFISMLLAAMMLFSLVACGNSSETSADSTSTSAASQSEESTSSEAETVDDLADWAGTWNAMTTHFDDPELESVFNDGAEACSMTVEELKAAYGALISTEYPSMTVEGNAINFYSEVGGESPAATISYTYAGQYTLPSDDEELVWYEFQGDTDGDYKYLAITFPERDAEDQVEAIHYRNGAESFEALFGEDVAGAATLISSESTTEEIQNTLSPVFEELAAYFAAQAN